MVRYSWHGEYLLFNKKKKKDERTKYQVWLNEKWYSFTIIRYKMVIKWIKASERRTSFWVMISCKLWAGEM